MKAISALRIPSPISLCRSLAGIATAALILFGFADRACAIDANATKQIWKLKYGVSETQINETAPDLGWLSKDDDGDGMTNGAEMAAGTNPFSAGGGASVLKITSIVNGGTTVDITFTTEIGKQYDVQGTPVLTTPFAALSPVVTWVGTSASKTLTGIPKGANKFFRVLVQDVDTDGDGVSNWAENAVGLNPSVAETIFGLTTLAYVNQQIALPNVVTITAAAPFASEDGPTAGQFTVTRTQDLFPITVNYGVAGSTAVAGTDYAPALPGSVAFLARGPISQDIFVNPIAQAPLVKGSRSVTRTLSPAGAVSFPYTIGSSNTATVIINPSTAPTGTGLLAKYYDTSSTTYANVANFDPTQLKITRVDPTVNFDWAYGTPNDVAITNSNPALNNQVDNYSSVWEGYLNITAAGNYTFQLDADDKAQVLLDTGAGLVQVLEHGWDGVATPETVGTFKLSAPIALAVQRYKIRVEHVETTGDARCRLQWRLGTAAFANIPQANVFSQTQAATYVFTRTNATTGTAVVTLAAHGLANLDPVTLAFSAGNLFTPNISDVAGYSGPFTVANATANTFEVAITGTNLPATGTAAACFLENRPLSTTTGWFNRIYTNTTFSNAPGRVGVDATGATTANNGIWGSGTPDPTLIGKDTFSIRWTGQVQPQFSEDYVFTVVADDGCALKINGVQQVLKMLPSASTGTATYAYNSGTGDLVVTYTGLPVVPSSFVAGETIRLDLTSGNLLHSPAISPTYTYDGTTAIIDYSNLLNRTPGSYVAGETVELDPTSGGLSSLANLPYVILASPAPTATTFAVAVPPTLSIANVSPGSPCVITTTANHGLTTGNTVYITSVSGGTFSPAINSTSFTVTVITPTTFSVASNCTLAPVVGTGKVAPTVGGNINVNDTRNLVIASSPAPTSTTFTVNIGTGKYANASTGNMNVDIVNKSLKDWSSNGNERYVRIPMIGGVRYDIQLDYYDNTGYAKSILSWFSASQPKQVIPSERLYPSSLPANQIAPPAHITSTDATALSGGFYSLAVAGSNGSTVSMSGNPLWLAYGGGVLSGTPPLGTSAGDYQIIFTITNLAGTSTSVLNLHVDQNTGSVVREYWDGSTGTSVAGIPTTTPTTGTNPALTTLEAPTAPADAVAQRGARMRGYITAPTTGNYYFWVAASGAAELWISNDAEPVNAFKRAWVNSPGSAVAQTWTGPGSPKSPWLALEQGKKYYFEVLHNTGGVTPSNLAVGWAKPGEASAAPSQVVPGFVLSPYVAPAPGSTPGTLYLASMLAQAPAISNGVGSSTLRLSEDENTAYMKRSYSGLTGSITSEHIHADPYLAHPTAIIYDIDAPVTPGDGLITNPADPNFGAYKWTILAVGGLTKADIVELLKEGKAYINLHTAAYPNGEIRGNYTLANGTRTFTPPPAPPGLVDDHATNNGAARFLTQATFGANASDIAALKAMASYDAWIDDQFNIVNHPITPHLPEVLARELADVFGPFDVKVAFDSWWKTSMTASDQLRQRIASALIEIHVVSGQGPLEDNSRAMAHFYDALLTNAFGNFRDILVGTTLTPGMGRYLDMLGNDKPDLAIGRSPNENYAREIQQLFSIGLFRMWPDGTLMLTSTDAPIDTYSQREIVGFAHTFTGWSYGYDGDFLTSFIAPTSWTRVMREVPLRHFTGPKRILNNEVLPGLATVGGQPLDPYATHISAQYNDPAYQGLPAQELAATHDQLFNHANVGPFICRQLIQRLVTSNPSRDYLYRVVQKFNDNGSGVRGDMKAVIKAILLDYEARSTDLLTIPAYGRQREPMMRVANAARAFRPSDVTGTYSQTGALSVSGLPVITITTSTSHLLQTGNSVFLEFTDTTPVTGQPAPTTGVYVVTVTDGTHYTINAPGWMTGTYSQTVGSNVMTVTMNGHWLPGVNGSQPSLSAANWGQAYFDFTSGTANGLVAFDQTVRTVATSTSFDTPSGVGNISGTTFTITSPDTTARSGNVMIARFGGTYQCTGRNGTITIDTVYGGAGTFGTMADHGLSVGNSVFLNFMNSRDTTVGGTPTSTENDIVYTIASVPDANTFTVPARDAANAAMNSDNQVTIFPLQAQPLVRNGTVSTRQSTFVMDNTDGDLGQTPINSTTVFNYFLPGYKYPGTLASQGITTPEFQGTAETTVVRHANFLYDGIFNPSNTTGISSFKAGTNALVLDLSPWMGNAVSTAGTVGAVLGAGPQTGQIWTSNANVSTLIDRLNTLLLAGQLPVTTVFPNTTNAKAEILKLLGGQISSISVASPCVFTMGTAHGLAVGDSVTVTGVTGGTFSTTVNATFTVASSPAPTATTFALTGLNCTSIVSNGGLGLTNSNAGIIPYTNVGPSATNIRDRLRTIVHLILTSPDYTIQR